MVSMRRILAISKKNLLALIHDKRAFGLLIFMPILIMLFWIFIWPKRHPCSPH